MKNINSSEITRPYPITLIMILLRVIATTFLLTTYDVPDTDLSEYICSLSLFSQNLWDKILILYLSTETQSVTKGNLFMLS